MNLETIINIFVGSLFIALFFIYAGIVFLNVKIFDKRRLVLIILSLAIFFTCNNIFLDNALRIMVVYIIILLLYKLIFSKNTTQCIFAAIIAYLFLIVGEFSIALGISILDKMHLIGNANAVVGNAIANFLISIIASLLTVLLGDYISKIINKVKENNKVALIITFVILLIAICSLFYQLSFNEYKFDKTLIWNLLLIVAISYIGIIIIKQRYDNSKISDKYERVVEYSKQSERLIEQYSISQHENKNELIVIRSMVHKSNKKLLEYLNEIIADKDNIKDAWIRYLRYIPFGGLKGIIHNKISKMKELGINVFLNISKNVGKSGLSELSMKENNQLSKIIGVFLDNATEAAVSSAKQEVVICIYTEGNSVIFEIANSYTETVKLENIYEAGKTTKGKNRGYGLTLVKTIVDENPMFENQVSLEKDFFTQKLKVNIKK